MQDLFTFIANHMALSYAFVAALILLTIVEFLRMKRSDVGITTAQAVQLINRQNANVVDLRASENFKQGHIIDAVSLTAKEITDGSKKIEKLKSRPVIIVCNAGMESQKIAALLLKQGYNAFSLSGPNAVNITNPFGRNTRRHSRNINDTSSHQGNNKFAQIKSID